MPTVYIKANNSNQCEITDFKDVTVIIDLKQRFNYISFNIKNNGEQAVDSIEIVLPFKSISNLKYNKIAKECTGNPRNNNTTEVLFKMIEPLTRKNSSIGIEIGFMIPYPEQNKKLMLHFYNLTYIKVPIEISNSPPIDKNTMELWVVLPESLEKHTLSPYTTSSENISDIKSRIKNLYDGHKLFKEERFHEAFVWTKNQLLNIEDVIKPKYLDVKDKSVRCVHFEFEKKHSIRMFRRNFSYAWIGIVLSIISLIIGIISLFFAIFIFKC